MPSPPCPYLCITRWPASTWSAGGRRAARWDRGSTRTLTWELDEWARQFPLNDSWDPLGGCTSSESSCFQMPVIVIIPPFLHIFELYIYLLILAFSHRNFQMPYDMIIAGTCEMSVELALVAFKL